MASKEIAWLTDIHLNFLSMRQMDTFLKSLSADGYIISGDIGEAHSLTQYLVNLAERLKKPIYFVLGNHDFYYGSIVGVRKIMSKLVKEIPNLHYLNETGVIQLDSDTALVGHDGWADGRLGNYAQSPVMLNDYLLIREFSNLTPKARLGLLNKLGDETASFLRNLMPLALANYRHVIVVTHVPPFREACWHEGQISNDDLLPHFACQSTGIVLKELASRYPETHITALCGHTHGSGEVYIRDNLHVITGGAEYGKPVVQRTFKFEV